MSLRLWRAVGSNKSDDLTTTYTLHLVYAVTTDNLASTSQIIKVFYDMRAPTNTSKGLVRVLIYSHASEFLLLYQILIHPGEVIIG